MSSAAKRKTTEREWFCDLSVGFDRSGISPTIKMCHKPAKPYKFAGVFGGIVALCEDHKDWTPRLHTKPEAATVEE